MEFERMSKDKRWGETVKSDTLRVPEKSEIV
jgi:hypothetical protein